MSETKIKIIPKLSVVIAAWNNLLLLQDCLESLRNQMNSEDAEIIVVSNYDEGASAMIAKRFAIVKHVVVPEDTTVPELRAKGVRHASGAIVTLLEDHCTVDKNWCAEIVKAHDSPYSIIGGSIENASRAKLLDWAVYFYDYGKYMLPVRAGAVATLSGNNVSYKRHVLAEIEESFKDNFFETFVHEELHRRGHSLYLMPSAIVYHTKRYVFRDAFVQCYHLARSFAARRVLNVQSSKRFVFVIASLTLPVLLPVRIASNIIRKRRHVKELVLSFPILVVLMFSWSWGEFCGYLRGEGTSAGRWR